jgi:hypothetical protein
MKRSNNTGAIAGGVVGGVIFLVAIGSFLLWWLQRHRRLRTAPPAAYTAAYRMARPSTSNSLRPGLFDERAGSPLASYASSNSRTEAYRVRSLFLGLAGCVDPNCYLGRGEIDKYIFGRTSATNYPLFKQVALVNHSIITTASTIEQKSFYGDYY